MRYEVRTPGGKLIGLYTGPDVQRHVKLLSMTPLKPYVVGDSSLLLDEEEISYHELSLDVIHMVWVDQSEIPTLVLRSGKRTWLNNVKGFRRI